MLMLSARLMQYCDFMLFFFPATLSYISADQGLPFPQLLIHIQPCHFGHPLSFGSLRVALLFCWLLPLLTPSPFLPPSSSAPHPLSTAQFIQTPLAVFFFISTIKFSSLYLGAVMSSFLS